jgi:signal transduction histidine kinase
VALSHRLERLEFGLAAASAAVLLALTAAITVAGSDSRYDGLEALARVLMVAVPIAVGVHARRHSPFPRFGTLLIAAGVGWFLTTLAGSQDGVLYSVGRVSGWIVEAALVYLVLAYPTGRLTRRVDRLLVAAIVVVVVVLYLPTALLVEQYPVPTNTTSCIDRCPRNAFMVVASEPAFVDSVVRPLRELLTILIFAGATASLAQRLNRASRLMRLTLGPVVVVAIGRLALLALGLTLRRVAPDDEPLLATLALLIALALPALAVAFLVGVTRWRLFIAVAMQRLAARLRGHPRPEDLRAALAEAFDDPSLEVAYWLDDVQRWSDEHGHPVDVPAAGSGRVLTEVRDGDRRVASMIHDTALRDDRAFVDAASSYAVMALDNHRLSAQAAALLREVRGSRARIQQSADDERRRIERDLHDGAQQRLVTLRIKLELAAERMDDGSAKLLRGLGSEVEEALDEVRSLARGIYPAQLADSGLVEALRGAAIRAPLPTTVLAAGVGRRYSRDVESAAYFCCLEALQNAAKHASGATVVLIEVSDNGSLRFAVRDDGDGFDMERVSAGLGMTSMRDRVAAVGGELTIASRPGRGTEVSAEIALGGAPLGGAGVAPDA